MLKFKYVKQPELCGSLHDAELLEHQLSSVYKTFKKKIIRFKRLEKEPVNLFTPYAVDKMLSSWVSSFDSLESMFLKFFPRPVIDDCRKLLSKGFLRPSDVTLFLLVRSGLVDSVRSISYNPKLFQL